MKHSFASYFHILIIGLFIDGLQIGMSWGLAVMVVGASSVPVAGWLLGTALVPIGILLGMVITFSISATLGGGFLSFLAFQNMFYPRVAFVGLLGEMVPGINTLPLWTAIAVGSIRNKLAEGSTAAQQTTYDQPGEILEEQYEHSSVVPPAVSAPAPQPAVAAATLNRQEAERPARARVGADILQRPLSLPQNDNRQKTAYAA